MSKIFISYRRDDSKDVVGRIYDHLKNKYGAESIFKDVESIPLGTDFRGVLDNSIKSCDVVLAVIGDKWLNLTNDSGERRIDDPDDFVSIEIEAALKRGVPVIPVLVRDAEMPNTKQLPSALKKLAFQNGLQVRADPDFNNDIKRLIVALNRILKQPIMDKLCQIFLPIWERIHKSLLFIWTEVPRKYLVSSVLILFVAIVYFSNSNQPPASKKSPSPTGEIGTNKPDSVVSTPFPDAASGQNIKKINIDKSISGTGIKLSVVPAEGKTPFNEDYDVAYKVYEAKKDMDGRRKRVEISRDAQPLFKLVAGKYLVTVKRGNAYAEKEVEIKAGVVSEYTFNLNTGNLKLFSLPASGTEPFKEDYDVAYKVYEAKKDMDGRRKKVDISSDAQPLFKLAAGQYLITAKRGNAYAEKEIKINAGTVSEYAFNLNTGNLKLFTLPSDGVEPFEEDYDVSYKVYEAKKDMDGRQKRVDISSDAQPLFKLAAGKYIVRVDKKGVQREVLIEIKASEFLEHTFIIN